MIRVGIGGWTFEPWRGVFYPPGLPHAKELHHASRQVTSIEINGTFYSTQKRDSFKKWAQETPDVFIFSLKAPRYAVNRRVLGEASESITRFIASGIAELGPKLGPILWQFAPTKKFEPEDFAAFLVLLPAQAEGRKLRHALEVRHDSFRTPDFIQLARQHKCAIVLADSDKHPAIADLSADFVYARLQNAQENVASGYPPMALKAWAQTAHAWAAGEAPKHLPYVASPGVKASKRDVFVYMINGAKVRAPAAAQALLKELQT